ncbi:MAG: 7-cyano-7-deazaguanine synthase [Deltaproteobacteria bacterium]|nr:7-cyano-7-deazaguanine synthase [Deltaproteobacteria bacterium]
MAEAEPILLGFSGGVDSSLAAVLLRQAGHEVLALTLKMDSRNPAAEDEKAARATAIAKQLGIRHQIEDARQAFQEEVLAPAWEEYQRGRTPNPCARCKPGFQIREPGSCRRSPGHPEACHRSLCSYRSDTFRTALASGPGPQKRPKLFSLRSAGGHPLPHGLSLGRAQQGSSTRQSPRLRPGQRRTSRKPRRMYRPGGRTIPRTFARNIFRHAPARPHRRSHR